MAISNLALVLGIVIAILAGIVLWDIISNHNRKDALRKCSRLKECKKGADCAVSEVCFDKMCVPRKLCTLATNVACPSGQKCYPAGDLGYCVPDITPSSDDRGDGSANPSMDDTSSQ